MGLKWPDGVGSPLSTVGSMHIAMELKWLPSANWLRKGQHMQMTYPWATISKRGPIAQLEEQLRCKIRGRKFYSHLGL